MASARAARAPAPATREVSAPTKVDSLTVARRVVSIMRAEVSGAWAAELPTTVVRRLAREEIRLVVASAVVGSADRTVSERECPTSRQAQGLVVFPAWAACPRIIPEGVFREEWRTARWVALVEQFLPWADSEAVVWEVWVVATWVALAAAIWAALAAATWVALAVATWVALAVATWVALAAATWVVVMVVAIADPT